MAGFRALSVTSVKQSYTSTLGFDYPLFWPLYTRSTSESYGMYQTLLTQADGLHHGAAIGLAVFLAAGFDIHQPVIKSMTILGVVMLLQL